MDLGRHGRCIEMRSSFFNVLQNADVSCYKSHRSLPNKQLMVLTSKMIFEFIDTLTFQLMFFPMCDNHIDVFSMFSKGTNNEDSKAESSQDS